MNLRWLWGNFADPEFQLTRKQQHEVTWLAHRKYLSRWRLNLMTAIMVLGAWLMVGLAWDGLAGVLRSFGLPWARAVSLAVLCIVPVVLGAWLYRFLYARPVRRAMRDLGYDLCLDCGYRLAGLVDSIDRCPECGSPREKPVQPSS